MFDNVCTSCHRRQLIFPSQVTGLDNVDGAIVVTYTCWCGADQTWLSGKRSARPREVVTAA